MDRAIEGISRKYVGGDFSEVRFVEKRIDSRISRTAEYTCSSRAASYYETNPCYRSDDYFATLLVPWFVRYSMKNAFFRRLFLSKVAPKGIYEYVIARTKFIDSVFMNTITGGIEQVLIFGAGFDTRSIRLLNGYGIKVFEMDSEVTQKAKIRRFGEVGVPVPNNTHYVSVDFNKENPVEKLLQNGFQPGKSCLFILEGLLMYLDDEAVDKTFKMIHRISGPDSLMVFDYIYSSVIEGKGDHYGEKKIKETVANAGEHWTFGFPEGKIKNILDEYGFRLLDEAGKKELERRFFKNYDGSIIGKLNGTHSIVLASIS